MIEKCRRYAVAANRQLVVDTTRSGLHDCFWNYFENTIHALVLTGSEIEKLIHNEYQGAIKLWDYNPIKIPNRKGKYDSYSQQLLSFHFNREYKEKVILHEAAWKGEFLSIDLLKKLRFKTAVSYEIKHRLPAEGTEYSSIHIRNTDYTTNYQDFLRAILKIDMSQKILICSDDFEVFQFAQQLFGDRFFRISKFSNNNKQPLHKKEVCNQFETNIEALTDLIALALGEKLYFTNVEEIKRASGFSILAEALHRQKTIATHLLSC